jgi:ATP-binding cassette subfamily B protein
MQENTAYTTTDNPEKISMNEFFSISKWVFLMVFKLYPFKTIIWIISASSDRVRGLLYTYIFAKAIDEMIKLAQNPGLGVKVLFPYLGMIVAFDVIVSLLSYIRRKYVYEIRTLSRPDLRYKFYSKLNELGIQTLEQPEVNNKINRADDFLTSVVPYLSQGIDFFSLLVSVVTTGLVLSSKLPFLIPIITVAYIPWALIDKSFRRKAYNWGFINTEKRRIAGSSSADISDAKDLQEISIIGAFKFLSDKYLGFYKEFNTGSFKIQTKSRNISTLYGLLTNFVSIYGYIKIFERLMIKDITVGGVTFWIRAVDSFQYSLNDLIMGYNELFETSIQLKDTYTLFNTKTVFKDGDKKLPKLTFGPEIEYKNVEFHYPNTQIKVINGFNLRISAGEKIAIVGINGAGKTTLIKLLSRFYPVSEGQILINGVDIKDLSTETLYQNMGVLFQDFNHYPQLSVKENIYIGDTKEPVDETKIRLAAEAADASEFIGAYPNKYDQILSERYKGGIRPSTGQWQKIAIARFFYRNAPLVIFDEPTASIDAASEYNIFGRIYDFFKDKTVIIISHRFSTVRNADRIVVLDKGEIIEEGTHTELMAKNGNYSKAFLLQAEGYKD